MKMRLFLVQAHRVLVANPLQRAVITVGGCLERNWEGCEEMEVDFESKR